MITLSYLSYLVVSYLSYNMCFLNKIQGELPELISRITFLYLATTKPTFALQSYLHTKVIQQYTELTTTFPEWG